MRAHQVADPAAQLHRAQLAGVEDRGAHADAGEQLAFELDGLDQRAVRVGAQVALGQRVRAARLGEAAHQRVGAGVEEHRAHLDAFVLQALEQRHQARQRAGGAHVHGHRDAAHRAFAFQAQELGQQLGRQVVDAEEAGVLQRVQRDGLAGTGDAGDQHDLARAFGAGARLVRDRAGHQVVEAGAHEPSLIRDCGTGRINALPSGRAAPAPTA